MRRRSDETEVYDDLTDWRRYPMVRADVEQSRVLQAEGEGLPDRYWLAYVWEMSGIPTAPICAGGAAVLPEPVDKEHHMRWLRGHAQEKPVWERRVQYYPVGEIAAANGRWFAKWGLEEVLFWIEQLEAESSRQTAWNYAHGHYFTHNLEAPNMAKELLRQRHSVGMGGRRTAPVQTVQAELRADEEARRRALREQLLAQALEDGSLPGFNPIEADFQGNFKGAGGHL